MRCITRDLTFIDWRKFLTNWFFKKDKTKKYTREKKTKLRLPLELGEEALILAGRLKKKDSPGKFCKSSVESESYSNKQETFLTMRIQITDRKYVYWLKSTKIIKT